jgi:ABC-type transport system substrate-binding protein
VCTATLALVALMPCTALATVQHVAVTSSPQTVTIANTGSPTIVDPLIETSNSVLDSELFSHLAVYDGRGHLQPDLLAALPSVANRGVLDNGRTIILRLKRHQYWSRGVEITSDDLVFGWKVLLDGAKSPAHCTDTRCQYIDSVVAMGRYAVRLHLKHPYAPLLPDYLPPVVPHSWPRLGDTPHAAALKLYDDSAFNYLDASYWTNGPYRIKQLDPSSGRAVLARMKYYRVHPGPYFPQLVISPQRPADLVTAVVGGQVDVAAFDRPTSLASILSHPGAYAVLLSPTFDVHTLEFNVFDPVVNGHTNPVHDVRVRQALSLALDRVGLTASALSVGRDVARRLVAYTPYLVSPYSTETGVSRAVTGAWDPLVRRYVPYGSQAIRDARRLLAAAGYASGLQVDVLAATRGGNPVPWFDAIKRDWAAIGVQAGTSIYPGAPLGTCTGKIIAAGQFEAFLTSGDGGPDPDELSNSLDSKFVARYSVDRSFRMCNGNYSGVEDRTVDKGLRRGAATYDPSQRVHWYGQVQDRVAKQAYWAPLFYQPNVVIANRHLHDVTGYPLTGIFFNGYPWNAYSWRYVP